MKKGTRTKKNIVFFHSSWSILMPFELRHSNKRQCTRLSIHVKSRVVWLAYWLHGYRVPRLCCMVCGTRESDILAKLCAKGRARRYTLSL